MRLFFWDMLSAVLLGAENFILWLADIIGCATSFAVDRFEKEMDRKYPPEAEF